MPKRSDNLSNKGGLRRFKFKTSSEWLPPKVKGAASVKAPDYGTSVKSGEKASKKASKKAAEEGVVFAWNQGKVVNFGRGE